MTTQIATTTIGQYLLDKLLHLGVHHIFGVPGDYVLRFNKLIEEHEIQFINTTRENTAGYMADAYSRMRGLGVACITYGVGVNIANALSQAYVESSPLVMISGTAGANELAKGYPLHHLIHKPGATGLDTTQVEIFKNLTIDQAILNNPETAAQEMDRVLYNCLRYQKPVYIELPRNQVDTVIPSHPQAHFPHPESNKEALAEALAETAKILNKCKKPFLWIGHEVQRFGLVSDIVAFAEKHHIPFLTSMLGKTAVSESHPLFAGVFAGNLSRPEVTQFVESCDCALIIGLIMSDIDTGIFTAKLEHDFKVIAHAEDIAINSRHYAGIQLADYVTALSLISLEQKFNHDYPVLSKASLPSFKPNTKTKITTARFFECLQTHLSGNNILITDIGDSFFGAADLILEQNSFLACAYFGSLGFAAPGAIGAQLAAPDRRVIALIGDGAFQMTGMELSTAVRYKQDPIVFVLNNHGYGTERLIIEGEYNDIQEWNYSALPQVIGGGIGIRVQTEEDLEKALTQALSNRGSCYIIEVLLGKLDFSPAMQRFSKQLGAHAAKRNT